MQILWLLSQSWLRRFTACRLVSNLSRFGYSYNLWLYHKMLEVPAIGCNAQHFPARSAACDADCATCISINKGFRKCHSSRLISLQLISVWTNGIFFRHSLCCLWLFFLEWASGVLIFRPKGKLEGLLPYFSEDFTCVVCERAFFTARQLERHQRKKRHWGWDHTRQGFRRNAKIRGFGDTFCINQRVLGSYSGWKYKDYFHIIG